MGIVNTKAVTTINRLILPIALCVLAAAARGQDAALEDHRPLDLSVPGAALTRAWGASAGADAARLPGLGESANRPGGVVGSGRGADRRSDLPYGVGYEARHGQGGAGVGHGRGRGH